ncbi:MAG: hypothetical protein K2P81_17230 [Bacteriovoracaceae bacterium]|nr:hypothetical protein [Bacteriovoracaceae bacterium]
MKYLLLTLFVFQTCYAAELDCVYKRNEEGKTSTEHAFKLMPSRSSWEKNFRSFGFKAKVENESLTIEISEENKVKVATTSLRDPWGKKRSPSEPEIEFEVGKVKIAISCH